MKKISERKGSSSPKNVPADILEQLNAGMIASVNLGESLAVDNIQLFKNICEEKKIKLDTSVLENNQENRKLMTCYKNIGRLLFNAGEDVMKIFAAHLSDIPRCWACLAYGYMNVSFEKKMEMIKPFADDVHMGVREMAWMALREDISADPEKTVELLAGWTKSDSPYIRRCASEATRPRGVWCTHIARLKENPETGLVILEPLRSDNHKYVQDSVANWLNDASKSKPEWVISVTERWLRESPAKETAKICKRALRTINKSC